MANFCVKCGTKLDRNGQCPNCAGTGVSQQPRMPEDAWANAPQMPVEATQAAQGFVDETVRLQNAPRAIDPDQTVKAPPVADPDRTVKAPPAPRTQAPQVAYDKTVSLDSAQARSSDGESAADYFGPNAMPPYNNFGFAGAETGDKTVALNPTRGANNVQPGARYPAQVQNARYQLDGNDAVPEGATQAGVPMQYQPPYGPGGMQYDPNGMQPPYAPNGMQYGPSGMQPPYQPNDGHTVAIDPTDDRTMAVDYGEGYPPYSAEPEAGAGKKKHTPLIVVIVVLVLLLLGSGTLIALQYFEKVDLPVVSQVVDFLFGAKEDDNKETDGKQPSGENSDAPADPNKVTDPAGPAAPSTSGTESVSGLISKDSAGNVILTLNKEKTFAVPADKQSIYGETVTTSTVRLQAADADRYVGVYATATGAPKFDSTNASDKTVTIAGCTFTESNTDRKNNEDHGLTFPGKETEEPTTDEATTDAATPDYVGKNVTIRMPNGGANDTMRVRSAPSYDDTATTVTSVRNGDVVKVVAAKNGWVKIEVNGKTGWCNAVVAGIDEEPKTTLSVASVSTSSNAKKNDTLNRTYTGENATDGNTGTCWMSSGSAKGTGEWVQLKMNGSQSVRGIKFLNGNVWGGDSNNRDPYHKTARVKSFTLTFSDGSTKTYTAKDTRETSYGANIFFFDAPIDTDTVRLTVNSVYSANSNGYSNVVSISEIQVF